MAYQNVNVTLCAECAGFDHGEEGAIAQEFGDVSFLRSLPNMRICEPCDEKEARAMVSAMMELQGPSTIRMGSNRVRTVNDDSYVYHPDKGVVLRPGKRVAILASGRMVQESLMAADELSDLQPTVVNITSLKPIDKALLLELARTHELLVSVEEHTIIGGLGSAIAEVLAPVNRTPLVMIGMQDVFGESGTSYRLRMKYGLSALEIVRQIRCHL